MWCQLRSPKSPLSSSAPGSQSSRRLAPHQLLQLSRAHSAPPPCFPSLVPLELGLDVERTLSSGHKLKGKPWVPQGLLFHPPFLSQETSVFFFTRGPDPEALQIAFPPIIQYSPGFSQGGSARGQGQVKEKRGMFLTLHAVCSGPQPHGQPFSAPSFQHPTLGCRLPCPLLYLLLDAP